jgi:hypothetical protein
MAEGRFRIEDVQKVYLAGKPAKVFKAFEYSEKARAYVHIGQFSAPQKTPNSKLWEHIDPDAFLDEFEDDF